jgi:uncharacterized protein (DUF58 family)
MSDSASTFSLLDATFMNKLERMALLAKKVKPGMSKGERKSNRKGSSIDFADYRDYVQGDDLRHIDWNIYSRLETLNLKLFEEREDLTLHLLIDASESMKYGTPLKIEMAQKLAAALGYIALAGHERVSIEAFSEGGVQRITPCRGRASVRKLFGFIEGISASGGTQLEQSGKQYLARNRSRGVAVLLTDFFDEDGFEGVVQRMALSRSEVHVLHILSPEEMDPALAGDLKLIDSETNAFAEVSMSGALLKRYNANRDGFIASVRKYCTSRGVGYAQISSDDSLEAVVFQMLRRGGMVR